MRSRARRPSLRLLSGLHHTAACWSWGVGVLWRAAARAVRVSLRHALGPAARRRRHRRPPDEPGAGRRRRRRDGGRLRRGARRLRQHRGDPPRPGARDALRPPGDDPGQSLGDMVQKGQPIAHAGCTGSCTGHASPFRGARAAACPSTRWVPAARLRLDCPSAMRAVSSVGRAPARQAGGHWFEPSTAHSRFPDRRPADAGRLAPLSILHPAGRAFALSLALRVLSDTSGNREPSPERRLVRPPLRDGRTERRVD